MGTLNTQFFNDLASKASWSAGVAFQRSNALPLDKYSVFETKTKAEEYLASSTSVAYPGQVIAVLENDSMVVYVVKEVATVNENGEPVLDNENNATYHFELDRVGIVPQGDGKSIEVTANGIISILGVSEADSLTLPRMKEDKSGIEWVPVSQVVQGDGNDNTTYEITALKKTVGEGEAETYGIKIKTLFNGTAIEGGEIEIPFDVYTKSEVDAAIAAEVTRATGAEEALAAKIGTASKPESSEGADDAEAATGLIADIEALQNTKADISYVDDEIAGLEDAISKLNHFTTKIVTSTDEVTETGILYLIKDTEVIGVDKYNEYLYIEGQGAVLIGDTTTDLSNYYNKTEIDEKVELINGAIADETEAREALAEKVTALENVDNATQEEFNAYKGEVTEALNAKADKTTLETLETSLYNGSYKKGEEIITSNIIEADREASRLIAPDEIAKLSALVLDEDGSVGVSGTISADNVEGLEDKIVGTVTGAIVEGTKALGIEKGAEVNIIEAVKLNGVNLTPDANRAVDVVISAETLGVYTKAETDAEVKKASDAAAAAQTKADTNESNLSGLTTRVGTVEGAANKNASDIAALVTKVAIEEGKVGTLETTVANKADTSTVTALAERVGTNEGNLTSLTTRVSANETAVTNLSNDKANKSEVYTKSEIDNKTGTITEGKTLVQMIAEAQTAASYDDTQVKADIKTNTDAIAALKGNDSDKTIREIAADEVNVLIGGANDSDTITNVTTLIEYVNANGAEVIGIKEDIQTNTENIAKNTEAIAAIVIATEAKAGLVKSSASSVENSIAVAADGTMTVNSLNVNKLAQTEGDVLVLNGGSASKTI